MNPGDATVNAFNPAGVASGLKAGKALKTSSDQQGKPLDEADSQAIPASPGQTGDETNGAAVQEESQDFFAAREKKNGDENILHEFVKSQGKEPDTYEEVTAEDSAAGNDIAEANIKSPGSPVEGASGGKGQSGEGSLKTEAVTVDSAGASLKEPGDDEDSEKTNTTGTSGDDDKSSPEARKYKKPELISFKDNDDPYLTCGPGDMNKTGGCTNGSIAGGICSDGNEPYKTFMAKPEDRDIKTQQSNKS